MHASHGLSDSRLSGAGDKRARLPNKRRPNAPRRKRRRLKSIGGAIAVAAPSLTAYDPGPVALLRHEHRGCNLLKSLVATWLALIDSGSCDEDAALRCKFPEAVEAVLRAPTADSSSAASDSSLAPDEAGVRRLRLAYETAARRCARVGRYRQFRTNRTCGVSVSERAVTALDGISAAERDMLERGLTWEARRLREFVAEHPGDEHACVVIRQPLLVVRSSLSRLRFDESLRESLQEGSDPQERENRDRYLLLARDDSSAYAVVERAAWKVLQSCWLPYLTLKLPVYPLLVKHWVLLTGDPLADGLRRRNVIKSVLRLLVPQWHRAHQRVFAASDERFAAYDYLFRIADCWNDPENGGLYCLRDAVRRSVGEESGSPRSFLSAVAAFLLMDRPHLLRVGALLALHRLFERGTGESGPLEADRLAALREDFRALRSRVNVLRDRCCDLSDDDSYVPLACAKGHGDRERKSVYRPSTELSMEIYRLCASDAMRPEDARALFLSVAVVGAVPKASPPLKASKVSDETPDEEPCEYPTLDPHAPLPPSAAAAYAPVRGLVGVRSRATLGTGAEGMWRRSVATADSDAWLHADERFSDPEAACATLFSTTVGLLAAIELGALSEKLLASDAAFDGVLNYGVRLSDFEGRSRAVHSHGASAGARKDPVVYEDELFVAFPSEFELDEAEEERRGSAKGATRVPDVVLETLFCHVPRMLEELNRQRRASAADTEID